MPDFVFPAFNNPVLPQLSQPDLVLATDNFDRADAATLGSTPVGNKQWTPIGTGTAASIVGNIDSGRAWVTASGTNRALAVVDGGQADVTADIKVATSPAANYSGIVLRCVDANNFLFAVPASNSLMWQLYKRVNGTGTLLVTGNIAAAAGDVLHAECRGSKINLYVNGVKAFAEQTVTDFQTATRFGFYGTGPDNLAVATRYDNFDLRVPGAWRA